MTATSGLRARPGHLFLSCGRTVLTTNALGLIGGETTNEGLFVDNTRLISREEILVDGHPIMPFVASLDTRRALLGYAEAAPTDAIPAESLYVEIRKRLDVGMTVDLRFNNYGKTQLAGICEIRLDADFADTQETHQGERQQSAPVSRKWDDDAQRLTLRYDHPQLDRATVVTVEQAPGPVAFKDGALVFDLTLCAGEATNAVLRVEPCFDATLGLPTEGRNGQVRDVPELQRRLLDEAPRLSSTNTAVAQAWRTAVEDLSSLPLGLPSGPAAPAAGMPLYQYLFGRDTLTVAWQAAMALPEMVADTLTANAAHQGHVIDDWRDEEPGKMTHQARSGPVSALGKNPFTEYFGDYATPQDFLILLGQHLAWTGDISVTRQLLPAARAAIDWLDRFGDLDGDGFLEYVKRSEGGVKNQGWKDSPDAIVDEHGEIVENPIATCEIQAYWYIGLRQAAFAFLRAGDRAYALELLGKARQLKARFDKAFWLPDERFYSVGLGPDKRPIRSITSNPGHLLATGIVPESKAKAVIDRLLSPELFSGWGIRTLSDRHPAYNPFSYHLGSVWPVDSATFALGFARYGHHDAVDRLAEAFFAAAGLFTERRLPESLGGLPRTPDRAHPGIYPESNEPQAWSASAVILLIQAILGLRPVAPAGLLLADPHLPAWLPDLRLEGIRVGGSTVDLEARRRQDGSTHLSWHVEGRLRVLRQPPPQAPITNPLRRAFARGESIFE